MSHPIEETYEVYSENRRRARKPHACSACSEPISVGHYFWYIFIIFEGETNTVKRCERCQAIHVHLRGMGDEMWPDERLACGEEYREHWGTEPPAEIAALAFALPGDAPCTT
jgi:hypothetical protein